MKKLKQASIERFVLAYKKHLQNLRDEFDIDDLYGGEEITINDFEEVEELKPYVWHPREKWDRNPKRYWLVERAGSGRCELHTTPRATSSIDVVTTYFMYIEPLEVEDDAS